MDSYGDEDDIEDDDDILGNFLFYVLFALEFPCLCCCSCAVKLCIVYKTFARPSTEVALSPIYLSIYRPIYY